MTRYSFTCLLLAAAVGNFASESRAQDDVTFLDHYRILQNQSRLVQSGGFYPRPMYYSVRGQYGFFHEVGPPGPAGFDNPDITGVLLYTPSASPPTVDVDQIFNLVNLKGEQLPVASIFDVYKFTGKTDDGSSVNLFAALAGPWMYVHGGTQPPAGSADMFSYDVKGVARTKPFADFNGDGMVDASDYTLLRDSGTTANTGAAGSLDVTAGATLDDWKSEFGESIPDFSAIDAMMMPSGSTSLNPTTVPEPSTLSFALIACGIALWSRRKSRQ